MVLSVLFWTIVMGQWFYVMYEIWTVKHGLGQQFGLTRRFLGRGGLASGSGATPHTSVLELVSSKKLESFNYHLWSLSGILMGILLYFSVTMSNLSTFFDFKIVMPIIVLLIVVFTLFTLRLLKSSNDRFGQHYLMCNYVLVVSSFIFVHQQYPFFFLLIHRVVHDLTAFQFYSIHDHNLQQTSQGNPIYRGLQWTKIPVFLLCPILAILVALPFTVAIHYELSKIMFYAGMMLGLIHYYTDSFVWKRDSIGRNYVPIEFPKQPI